MIIDFFKKSFCFAYVARNEGTTKMSGDEEVRENLKVASLDAVNNLLYTVVFDVSNEIISSGGADQEKVLEAANTVINRYVDGGIKVRKRPVPRPKTAKAPAKAKPIDTLTAASRKLKSLTDNILWLAHPDNEEYAYSTSVKLATGYPVKNNATNKIVMVATDESSGPLTIKDARIAVSLGLDVDYESIEQ